MNIKCNADKKGRTIGTAVRIVKPQNASKAEKRIARQIRKFIIHHISWKEDVDRSIFDDISFSIKYRR
jgi:phage gp29-like protein